MRVASCSVQEQHQKRVFNEIQTPTCIFRDSELVLCPCNHIICHLVGCHFLPLLANSLAHPCLWKGLMLWTLSTTLFLTLPKKPFAELIISFLLALMSFPKNERIIFLA